MSNQQQVSASHILVESAELAQQLQAELAQSATMEKFIDLAKQHSKCPSGSGGGNLGLFERGVMVKPFEDAAFSLEVGQLSVPVQTPFGWHLIVRTS
jgi:parvulin-like peptidyl-prolyl isomerase